MASSAPTKPPLPVDPLLADLAGDTTTKIDNLDVDTSPQTDPLEVAKPKAASVAATLDAKHSTAAGGKGWTVTVEGDYYAPAKDFPGKKILRPYRVTFNLPSLDRALSVIKNKLLEVKLRKLYPNEYLGFRTHEIVEAVPLSNETPESANLQFMARPALEAHIKSHRLPINPAEYPETKHLREAVIDCTLTPKGFEEREAKRQADRAEDAELAKMNADFDPNGPNA